MIPGEWLLDDDPIEINSGRRTLRISVRNTGDRPIQVGSHFHFFEVNRHFVAVAALHSLAEEGTISTSVVADAIAKYGIDPDKPDPARS